LDDEYGALARSDDPVSRELGEAMLQLIDRLRGLPTSIEAWGLTSLHHLCLLAADESRTPWYVRFIASKGWYQVEYLMPKHCAPWPGAYIAGKASNEAEAAEMLVLAIANSSGWQP